MVTSTIIPSWFAKAIIDNKSLLSIPHDPNKARHEVAMTLSILLNVSKMTAHRELAKLLEL